MKIFYENDIEEISYKSWVSTDRCKLLTVTSNIEEFSDSLSESLGKLVTHNYIAKTQSEYFRQLKKYLKEGEVLITLDFSENYPVVIQEAVQGHYWNNSQISLLPSVVYYKKNNITESMSIVGVLECLEHDTVSVYMFLKKLWQLLKSKMPNTKKAFYFSDGAPQQFKNKKNFTNLCLHNKDFDINAEWHFFATAHGKGPCDGLGGMVKAEARKACLQFGSDKYILNASDLFKWAADHFKTLNFIYCSNDDYTQTFNFLENRFKDLLTVKGTLGFHAFIPDSEKLFYLKTKSTSVTNVSRICKIKKL